MDKLLTALTLSELAKSSVKETRLPDLLRTVTFNLTAKKQFIEIHALQGLELKVADPKRVLVEQK